MDYIALRNVKVTDPFFTQVMRTVTEKVIPYQWEIINDRVEGAEKSHSIENFRIAAGEAEGSYHGAVFQDTDVSKWLEAVAYSLIVSPDASLEALADGVIDLIGRAQQPDGYVVTYYIIEAPNERWQNLAEGHELYTAGHLIEAAVAYHQATGKRRLLDIACRFADLIKTTFGTGDGQCGGYPGHPEIELALYRLADETGDASYAALAQHFLDVRGQGTNWFESEWARASHRYIFPEMKTLGSDYFQSHLPVRSQRTATGHAVRAMYLYSAMADSAQKTGDFAIREACEALYHNVTTRQMYITGSIGSASHGERFTSDYDLPNETMYAETCASIGLMLFSARMFRLTGEASCFDIWQRALQNTVLAGMNTDGNRFFYVNPLQVDPAKILADPTRRHVKPARQKWFGVACCPPNIARTILSIGHSLYAYQGNALYVLAHIPSQAVWPGGAVSLVRDGHVYRLRLSGDPCDCWLRLPEGAAVSLPDAGNGFACIHHAGGEQDYTYVLEEKPTLLRANPRVSADVGKAAIAEGSVVYCLESADNGDNLSAIYVDSDTTFERIALPFLPAGMHGLRCKGWRASTRGWDDTPYAPRPIEFEPCTLTAIPYSQWNNRGVGEMTVWMHVR